MDASSLSDSTNNDRISYLPQKVQHHILSFLDMKQAVQTRLLSTRWRYLWGSLPFLNFDEELVKSLNSTEERSTAFRSFVDHVLFARNETCIQKFHLDFPKENHLNLWIAYAKRYNVQELSIGMLYVMNNQEVKWLHGLFTCSSLKLLELKYKYISGELNKSILQLKSILPPTIDLPVLQTLLLHGLTFTSSDGLVFVSSEVDSFERLFSACPNLESLTIDECLIYLSHLNISSHKLRQLVINHREGSCVAVRVNAPNLLSFRCKDDMSVNYSLETLSSLEEADIFLGGKEHDIERTIKNPKAIQNVTTLSLSASAAIFQIFSETGAFDGTQFCNLWDLKFCAISSNSWFQMTWIKAMTCLIKVSPNIETVYLTGDISDSIGKLEEYEEAGNSLGSLKQLKFVEVKNVKGKKGGVHEFSFIENLLKNAVALQRMDIVFLPFSQRSNVHDDAERFSEDLLELPTASSSYVEMRIIKSLEHFKASFFITNQMS